MLTENLNPLAALPLMCLNTSQFVRSIKTLQKKLKQFSIILAKPISIDLVSNSMNKLYFHCQKVETFLKVKTVRKRLKIP